MKQLIILLCLVVASGTVNAQGAWLSFTNPKPRTAKMVSVKRGCDTRSFKKPRFGAKKKRYTKKLLRRHNRRSNRYKKYYSGRFRPHTGYRR